MAACSSCGAALAEGATACDLCGTPVATTSDAIVSPGPAAPSEGAAVCPSCGAVPPAGSRFCNVCGTPLAAAPPVVRSPTERPSSAPGRQGLIVAGLGILAVVALYGATLLSDRSEAVTPAEDVATVGTASPIPDVVPALPDSLQAAADAFASQNSASGWFESGRYYLTAAFNATQTDPTASVQWARRAIADFDKSLAIEEDPQVRVALAEAATFDPADPMRSVQELRAVLAADPDNVDALVLLAERRLMIGRTDSARVGFERVLALAPEGSLAKQRAQQGLDAVGQAGG